LQIRAKDNKTTQVSEFLDALKEITQGTWDEKDIASAEARFEKTNAVIKRLKSSESADRAWRKACLDTRQHVSFIANEIDADGSVVNVHSSDTGLSGGQKQKLVIFCLAAALRYQLADEDQPVPRYGTVVLDEAFDKADPAFARTAMDIFKVFGFHMVLATPYKLISLLSPYLGAIAAAHCRDSKYSSLTLVDFAECPDDDDEEESRGD
ncbi:MAG: SbcC/MukB-like Walker B domain-containing protein, partial [Raoultibacter sp.]